MTQRQPLIVVVGPTAAGKSALAVAIAGWLGGEVVSADAFQIYRGLDIGTAKIDAEAMGGIPHHCIDIADPDEHYTAGRFAREAGAAIAGIQARGRHVVVAGGGGFYLRALIEGLAELPEQDPAWRRALERIAGRRGQQHLYGMLEALDPEWAAAIGPADRQRTLRGLEVTLRLGMPMSAVLRREGWSGPSFDAVWIGLTWPRETLRARIADRVDEMLAAGWLREVGGLLDAGYGPESPGFRAIGYRQLAAHLAGELTFDEARSATIAATRRYAKRQMTWFRRQTPTRFLELGGDEAAAEAELHARIRAHLEEKLSCYL